jgi:tetratricopeptide (TPR) repeat protein
MLITKNPNNADDYACLGASYRMLGSFKKAIFYLKKAEDLSKNAILQNLISNQLGTTYLNLENYDKALYYYNEQLQISKEGEAEALNNMAFVY